MPIDLPEDKLDRELCARQLVGVAKPGDPIYPVAIAVIRRLNTQEGAVSVARRIRKFLGYLQSRGIDPLAATRDDIEVWMDSMSDQQPTSIAVDLTAARSLYAEAIDRDLLVKDPCRGVRVGRYTAERVPALSLAEAQGVLDAVRSELAIPGLRLVAARDNFLLTLCMVLGPRASEIRRLAWGDMDLDRDVPTVEFMRKFRKHDVQRAPDAVIEAAGHYRRVWEEELGYPPLPNDAVAIALWAGCAGRLRAGRPSESIAPMSDTALYGMIRSRLQDVGLSGRKLGSHRLRATAATLAWRGLVKQGNPDPSAVQRLMAHEHLSTTIDDYITPSDEMEKTAGNAVGITRLGAQGV